MNALQAHLAVNHLPIFGSILGLALVLFAVARRGERGVVYAATLVLGLSAAGGVGANLSGEDAEETFEDRPGVDEAALEAHEGGAKLAVMLLLLSAASGGLLSWRVSRGAALPTGALVGWALVNGLAVGASANMGLTGRVLGHPDLYGDGKVAEER